MVFLPVLLMLLLAFLPEVYIYFSFVNHWVWWIRILFWMPFIFMVLAMLCLFLGLGYSFPFRVIVLVLVCSAVPKLLFTLISLLGKLVETGVPHAFKVANCLGTCVALAALCCFAYGTLWGWKHLFIHEQTLKFASLPKSFIGYKIVHISDFHVGTFGKDSVFFRKVVNTINALDADLIVFTGDIVNSDPAELDPFMHVLDDFRAKEGVLSITGNHDYCTYGARTDSAEHARRFREVLKRERQLGWKLLKNEHFYIHRGNDSIVIVGVENIGRPPFPQKGDLRKARMGITEGTFEILLSHDPTLWRQEILPDTDIPLMLSGHTHATQFKVLGWSPASLAYKEWGGLYEEGGQKLFISTGTGCNIPFRFGAWPEVAVLTLDKE